MDKITECVAVVTLNISLKLAYNAKVIKIQLSRFFSIGHP